MKRHFRAWLDKPFDRPPPLGKTDPGLPILVVGAGPAGLAAMAELKRAGLAFEGIESHSGPGGIWDIANPLSTMYEGMRTATSRPTTHLGRPMPGDWPTFVPHELALRYLRWFAEEEGLPAHIRFGVRFVTAAKTARSSWIATLETVADGQSAEREYRAVVIATGSHNRSHRVVPPGLWDEAVAGGMEVIHSAQYRSPRPFAGKRVLVVGVGASGTDIAEKLSTVADRTSIAVRTDPWIVPGTLFGAGPDKVAKDLGWLPHGVQMGAYGFVRRLAIGNLAGFGLSTPRHALLDRIPVVDRGIVQALRSRRVAILPNVTGFGPRTARFAQAPDEPVDAVIFATGFRRHYPMLPAEANLDEPGGGLCFYLFHRNEPGLVFMTEVIGTRSCWPIFIEQARIVAAYFLAEERGRPNVAAFNARRAVATPNFKGKVFGGADVFHLDYRLYTRALRNLGAWLHE